jgi:hypothetical protein
MMNHPANSRYDLFSRGIYVDPMVETDRLRRLAQRLRPVRTNIDLIRMGAEEDGGYLVPDDLAGISACFSPGVDQVASFEAGLLKYGIRSHLADFSVDHVPQGVPVASFTKKFIGASDNDKFMSLEKWVTSSPEYSSDNDLVLQMDIEGGEYESLLSTPNEILRLFRVATIEFHNIETWGQRDYLSLVEATFEKLLNIFHVVHNHPNNAMGIVDMNGFLAPRLFELTLLRKDRVSKIEGFATVPHPLDRPNLPLVPDIGFPEGWV